MLKAPIRKISRAVLAGPLQRIASRAKKGIGLRANVSELLRSRHFDWQYYANAANLPLRQPRFAAAHYLLYGESRGTRPSVSFDPTVYIEANPDLQALPYSRLIHFIRHGEGEGRPANANLEGCTVPGKKQYRADKETAIVVVHEMSRTGAPILGLNLVESLSRRVNVVVVAARRGAMLESFVNAACCVVSPETGWFPGNAKILSYGLLRPLKERYDVGFVIVNSAEVAAFAAASFQTGLPCVSLVHEFADYVNPKSKITDIIRGSQRVVFSSHLTEKTFHEYWEFSEKPSNTCVIPQGKCDPPELSHEHSTEGLLDRFRNFRGALVIGCGQVQMRKGVDFFVATATSVIKSLGTDAVRFVWVGGGYTPKTDEYSRWLESQLERSGIDGAFEFVSELGMKDLRSLYDCARVMLLSSRLDPFPNVAIDAMHVGLPIVCFENASGVAEYIKNKDELRDLVVPHMDVGEASRQIVSLIRDESRYRRTSQALSILAEKEFGFEDYVVKLLTEVEHAKHTVEPERADRHVLLESGLFDGHIGWIGHRPEDREGLVRQYVRMAASNSFSAEPRLLDGLNAPMYARHIRLHSGNPLAHWIKSGKPAGPWLREVRTLSGEPHVSALHIAMHVHIHHPEVLPHLFAALRTNSSKTDLFITVTSEEVAEQVQRGVANAKISAKIVEVKNRGRDIGPMLTALAAELASYDLIVHAHGKKSQHIGANNFVDVWRDFLFQNVVGGKVPALDIIARMFEQDRGLGLVFPEDPFICGWGNNRRYAESLATRLGIGDLASDIEFPVGNMFVARTAAIARLFSCGFKLEDFPDEPVERDGTILHALERILPAVCEAEGYRWVTTRVDGVVR